MFVGHTKTRKRKKREEGEPSAGTPDNQTKAADFILDLVEDQTGQQIPRTAGGSLQSEAGPAPKKQRTISAEGLPLPKSGCAPVVNMILHVAERQWTARTLLDTGASVPLLSFAWAMKNGIPFAERPRKRTIYDFGGRPMEGAGDFFTSPLLIQHGSHYSRVSFCHT